MSTEVTTANLRGYEIAKGVFSVILAAVFLYLTSFTPVLAERLCKMSSRPVSEVGVMICTLMIAQGLISLSSMFANEAINNFRGQPVRVTSAGTD